MGIQAWKAGGMALAAVSLYLLSASAALADTWSPSADASGPPLVGFIDQFPSQVTAGVVQPIAGWVVDPTAEGWTGIDSVTLWIGGDGGSRPLAAPVTGIARPDVARALNNPYGVNAGFSSQEMWGVNPGTYTVVISAHTPGRGTWTTTRQVSVSRAPAPTPTPAPAADVSSPWTARCATDAAAFLSPSLPYVTGDVASNAFEALTHLCVYVAAVHGEAGVECFEGVTERWLLANALSSNAMFAGDLYLQELESC